jgi:probable rRNA maturation factor
MASLLKPLQLSLQFADKTHRDLLPRGQVQRWLRAALDQAAQITVRIVGSDEGRALNRDYRQKDYATNVLTFDYEREPAVVADLVLCAPVVAEEALAQGIDLQAHYAHLLVHGALHARGFDHITKAQAKVMQPMETEVLVRLGFDDPYRRAAASVKELKGMFSKPRGKVSVAQMNAAIAARGAKAKLS